MSGGGEFADPGSNRPDTDGAPDPDVVSPQGTQDAPVMDVHTATDEEKIDGIVDQTRVDVGDKPHARVVDVLNQRFADAGLEVAPDDVAALADRVLRR
ncbi:hypothetical protein AB0N73_10215 [Microbacterium sp. NPDC089189]|uniref:hypothetical protein n=1 Tax=Microbacterium sp. NPDC089189 TaxID=3154972 RepID=UPI00343A09E2